MKKLDLLKIIQNNPGINVQDLTEASQIDANMVIKLLNDMEREGWITRHRFYQFTCQVITQAGLDVLNPKPMPAPVKPDRPAKPKAKLEPDMLAALKEACTEHPALAKMLGTDNKADPYTALPKLTGMIS